MAENNWPDDYDPPESCESDLDRAEDELEEWATQFFTWKKSRIRCTNPACEKKPKLTQFNFPSGNVKLECEYCDGHVIFR